jgi:hypothetical protein
VLQRKLDAVPIEQLGKGAAPLLPLGSGDQARDVVRLGQGTASHQGRTRMVHGPTGRGKGLGAEKLTVGNLDRLAVETLNKGPALRSKIVLLQQDKA